MKFNWVSISILIAILFFAAPSGANAATLQQQGFFTQFNKHDAQTWQISDGWRNGDPFFGCHWSGDRVNFPNGQLELSIRSNNSLPAPYSYECAEYTTNDFYGYGLYEVSMKPSNVSGMISSFFTYTGPSYNGDPWDEIDIEFLGKDTTKIQFNYYTDGVGGNEIIHNLGFDASQSFNTYAFDWQPNSITWYVNGEPIATRTENIPSNPGKIMMNLWNTYGIDEWAGRYTGEDTSASYEWARYTPSDGTNVPPDLQLPACNYDEGSGVQSWNCGVGNFDAGNWIKFNQVNLSSGYNAFAVSYASEVGGSFDIRVGNLNGQTIGTVDFPASGGWNQYEWNGTPALNSSIQGNQDIYFISTSGKANLKEFWFKNE